MKVYVTFVPPVTERTALSIAEKLAASGAKVHHVNQHVLNFELEGSHSSQLLAGLQAAGDSVVANGEKVNMMVVSSITCIGKSVESGNDTAQDHQ